LLLFCLPLRRLRALPGGAASAPGGRRRLPPSAPLIRLWRDCRRDLKKAKLDTPQTDTTLGVTVAITLHNCIVTLARRAQRRRREQAVEMAVAQVGGGTSPGAPSCRLAPAACCLLSAWMHALLRRGAAAQLLLQLSARCRARALCRAATQWR
jgi:hypothetical protein